MSFRNNMLASKICMQFKEKMTSNGARNEKYAGYGISSYSNSLPFLKIFILLPYASEHCRGETIFFVNLPEMAGFWSFVNNNLTLIKDCM